MGKETLEEAVEKYVKNFAPSVKSAREIGFIDGAKWQAERMYNEEELRKMLFDLGDVLFNNCQNCIKEGEPEKYFNVIIEPFKKK